MRCLTRRQLITAAAYGDADRWPTQSELATRFGVSQAAISQRLARFEKKLSPEQLKSFRRRTRRGYRRALQQPGKKKVRLIPMQLSLVAV
jgi:DNA-binding MarR family transcriptional regulator